MSWEAVVRKGLDNRKESDLLVKLNGYIKEYDKKIMQSDADTSLQTGNLTEKEVYEQYLICHDFYQLIKHTVEELQ